MTDYFYYNSMEEYICTVLNIQDRNLSATSG
jgi:hypothetical protein